MLEQQQEQRSNGEVLRWCAAILTAAAAGIHFAVTPEHFDEDWAFGIFFAAAAWAQLLWAALLIRVDDRGLRAVAAVGNLAIALVWVVSRTSGVPIGPEPGAREAVGFVDVLATIWEVLAAVAIFVTTRIRHHTLSFRRAAALVAALAVAVVPLTTIAIVSNRAHAGPEHVEEGSHGQNTNG